MNSISEETHSDPALSSSSSNPNNPDQPNNPVRKHHKKTLSISEGRSRAQSLPVKSLTSHHLANTTVPSSSSPSPSSANNPTLSDPSDPTDPAITPKSPAKNEQKQQNRKESMKKGGKRLSKSEKKAGKRKENIVISPRERARAYASSLRDRKIAPSRTPIPNRKNSGKINSSSPASKSASTKISDTALSADISGGIGEKKKISPKRVKLIYIYINIYIY